MSAEEGGLVAVTSDLAYANPGGSIHDITQCRRSPRQPGSAHRPGERGFGTRHHHRATRKRRTSSPSPGRRNRRPLPQVATIPDQEVHEKYTRDRRDNEADKNPVHRQRERDHEDRSQNRNTQNCSRFHVLTFRQRE